MGETYRAGLGQSPSYFGRVLADERSTALSTLVYGPIRGLSFLRFEALPEQEPPTDSLVY
jgi:hypothetical protein